MWRLAGTKRSPPDDRNGKSKAKAGASTERAALAGRERNEFEDSGMVSTHIWSASHCTLSETTKPVSMRTSTMACWTCCFVRSCSVDLCSCCIWFDMLVLYSLFVGSSRYSTPVALCTTERIFHIQYASSHV